MIYWYYAKTAARWCSTKETCKERTDWRAQTAMETNWPHTNWQCGPDSDQKGMSYDLLVSNPVKLERNSCSDVILHTHTHTHTHTCARMHVHCLHTSTYAHCAHTHTHTHIQTKDTFHFNINLMSCHKADWVSGTMDGTDRISKVVPCVQHVCQWQERSIMWASLQLIKSFAKQPLISSTCETPSWFSWFSKPNNTVSFMKLETAYVCFNLHQRL